MSTKLLNNNDGQNFVLRLFFINNCNLQNVKRSYTIFVYSTNAIQTVLHAIFCDILFFFNFCRVTYQKSRNIEIVSQCYNFYFLFLLQNIPSNRQK